MSNIQTGAERMRHDLSHLGFLAGQVGRLIPISTTPVIAGDSFEMDAVGALRLSPLRRGLASDSTGDVFTFFRLTGGPSSYQGSFQGRARSVGYGIGRGRRRGAGLSASEWQIRRCAPAGYYFARLESSQEGWPGGSR